ncbi:CaiB/BaiF CoA transferase family protein [Bacillus massiliigorillae]|uniref:CaiB/BaiF CoA transferase family protein n=1 Tax=Bacillus massiliigorillae TaxID=1243664 RepID=UPI0003A72A79|nr:CaiB/BaiF CoA-transferase family protein [Bacillus massiliigorillae]
MLSHLKILDFTTLLPGPYATMMFADFGAEVIRVESPTRADLTRSLFTEQGEDSPVHAYLNRSKQAIALDLKDEESLASVKKIVSTCDIIIEQFRPGVMDRLGLGYEDLKSIKPDLIYCSITGYGQTGSFRKKPGHDNNYLALSGIASYSGTKKDGAVLSGVQIADLAGGSLHSVIAILMAVIHRDRTGEGQWIDISMTDCSLALNAFAGPAYLDKGIEMDYESFLLNGGSFYGYYETKDGRFFSVGSLEPPFKKLLCEAINQPELFEMSMSDKEEDIKMFKESIQQAFLTKTFIEWQEVFSQFDACVEPVLTVGEACSHPLFAERGMIVEVPTEKGGFVHQLASPIKTNAYKPEYKFTGVKLGQHTNEILDNLDK